MDLASFYINLKWFCPTTTPKHGGTRQTAFNATLFDLDLTGFYRILAKLHFSYLSS